MTEAISQQSLSDIGEVLIRLRKKKGYRSHEAFALDFNLPRVQYWRMEKGKTNFTIKSLARVLAIHEITMVEFFQMVADATVFTDKSSNRPS